jgi:dTDP-L-rhamnose 4-epimerase
VEKVVVASSQAVYDEGAYACPTHGRFYGTTRAIERLAAGDYAMHCPHCDAVGEPAPTDEAAPMGGENVYAISKSDQERLVLTWGRSTGIPVVALRYSCTYGPRQSVFNPYTGVIAIFCTRLMNDQPPLVYEDGKQSRDLIFVEDVARANMLVATDDRANGRVFNVGPVRRWRSGALASLLADRLGQADRPALPGPVSARRDAGADLRHLPASASSASRRRPTWRRIDATSTGSGPQGDVKDYFAGRRARPAQEGRSSSSPGAAPA